MFYRISTGANMAITASQARAQLLPLIEQVNDDHVPIEIVSKKGSAVLMSLSDFEALEETAYLLRTPANAEHLMASIAEDRAARATARDSR
jgi:antitoxin YefM